MATTNRGLRRLLLVLAAVSGSLLLAAGAAVTPAAALAASTVTRLGGAPASRTIRLELPLRIDSAGLSRFAAAVSTPGSPDYGRYASVSALARRFGASISARTRVLDYLRRAGAAGVRIDATGLFADATLRVGRAERLFGTQLARFRSAATPSASAARFLAPMTATHVPAALAGAVTGVVGLDTRPLVTANPARASAGALTRVKADVRAKASSSPPITSAYPARTGTATGCTTALSKPGFTPNQYLTAYGYNTLQAAGLTGQGERVALIEIDGFKESDVKAFASCFGFPVPHINAFGVGINKALPAGGESTLDLELLDAAAPRLSAVDVYESQPMASEVLRSLTEPLSVKGRTPDVISASLGTCEAEVQQTIGRAGINTVESALQLAAATGISVLASSGDDGSTACLTNKGAPLDRLGVNYPASSPWVTGVGGTNIKLSASNAIADPATDQIVWNDEPALEGAGGGGISTFPRPGYQNGVQSSPRREVPDVSMLADPLPGYEIYCTATSDCVKSASDSPWVSFGGTSAGTPLLAGGLALIDQQLREHGRENVGFANPLLYKIDRSPAAAATISDVVQGSNDLSQTVFGRALGCCSAAVGFDQASGLGSVNVAGLASAAATLVPRQLTVGLSLPAQRHPLAAEHLLATVSCSGECLMGAYARLVLGHAKPITAYSTPYELINRRSRTIRIGLSTAVRTKLRAALKQHERVTATVYGAIISASGAVDRQTAGKSLRITS